MRKWCFSPARLLQTTPKTFTSWPTRPAPGPVVRSLREAGHDVIAIAEIARGASDEQVLERALNEKRVLITEDLDFGRLVFSAPRSTAGVLLVRFPNRARLVKAATVVEAVAKLGPRLLSAFAVVEPGRVRLSVRP